MKNLRSSFVDYFNVGNTDIYPPELWVSDCEYLAGFTSVSRASSVSGRISTVWHE
jgi:hypothetical protein